MSLTMEELCVTLTNQYDQLLLCEVLDITPEDLVDRFDDRIAERYEQLCEEIEDE